MKVKLSDEQIKKAAEEDFRKQNKWDASFDRRQGFIQGAIWALKQANIELSKNKITKQSIK